MFPGDETVSTDEPDPLPEDMTTVEGLRDGASPEGDTVAVRETLPENPLMPVKEMLELAELPAGVDSAFGLAEIVKSVTRMVTWMECVREPLTAVTVTV